MKAILISGSYKKIEMPENIVEFIMKKTQKYKICFISADFSDYISNDKYVKKLIFSFEEHKLKFDEIEIIDKRLLKSEMIEAIKNRNIIFLLGGDTLKQIKSINEYGLKKYIFNDNKIVIGMSAGAINMANKVILAKDEEDNIPELSIYKGLGITDINIEPHCDFKNNKHWQELEKASFIGKLLIMNDNCYIIIDDNIIHYYGDYCFLNKGKLFYKDNEMTLENFLKEINYD